MTKFAQKMLLIATSIFVTVSVTGCAGSVPIEPVPATSEIVTSLTQYKKAYVLQAGDEIEVDVYRNPQFSRTVTVRPDGFISLPVLDEVKAAGLTPRQLDDFVTQRLVERLVDPEVTIIVGNLQEPMIYIFWEIGDAVAVPLRSARTVAQAVAHAGGVKKSGTLEEIAIVRLNGDGYLQATTLQSENPGQSGNLLSLQNSALLPDDLVLIPESGRSQFTRFVQDFVNTPLTSLNNILGPYLQLKILDEISSDSEE